MILDEIMESFCGLEKKHHQENTPMPDGILISLDAYRELPPNPHYQNHEDLKICGLPVSITDTKEFKFKWLMPKKESTLTIIQP